MNMERKVHLIKEITEFHPGSRPDVYRHYGWYVGGMKDTGNWYWHVMIDEPVEELEKCLELLRNPPKVIRIEDDPDAPFFARVMGGIMDRGLKDLCERLPFKEFEGEPHNFNIES